MIRWIKNVKNQMILMLLILAIVGVVKNGPKNTLPLLGYSIAITVVLDFTAYWIRKGKKEFPSSALITGLIIGLILPPDAKWYIPLTAGAIAILQKHLIRINNKHIFNPGNFGLLAVVLIYKTYLFWWGGSEWWLVLLLGLVVMYFFKRLELPISFLITSIVILGGYYAFKGLPVSVALKMVNIFFAFVMLVEPKTSPIRPKGRIIFGILTAVISSLLIIFYPKYDPFVVSLVITNMLVQPLNKIK